MTASTASEALGLVEDARTRGLGRLLVLVPATAPGERGVSPAPGAEPLAEHVRGANVPPDAWVVDRDELLQATRGVVVTKEGHGFAPERGELWFAGETAESVLLELEGRRQRLAEEVAELESAATAAVERAEEAERLAAGLRAAAPRVPAVVLERLAAGATRATAALTAARGAAERLETPLRARADAGGMRTGELAAELRKLGAAEAELRREAGEARERAGAIDVELATIAAERREATRRLRPRRPSPRRARTGTSSRPGSRSSAAAGRRSARSTHWRRRSTRARRSASRSWSSSARISRRASSSSSSCAPS